LLSENCDEIPPTSGRRYFCRKITLLWQVLSRTSPIPGQEKAICFFLLGKHLTVVDNEYLKVYNRIKTGEEN